MSDGPLTTSPRASASAPSCRTLNRSPQAPRRDWHRESPPVNPETTINWVVLCAQWPYTMHAMLQLYNELREDEFEASQEGDAESRFFPSDVNPLMYLYDMAKDQLSQDTRSKLDYDPDLFLWLVRKIAESDPPLNWDRLDRLRQYTVNFNPAVEAEFQTAITVPQFRFA